MVNKELKKKVDFNYKPFSRTPKNIRNHARKTNPIPMMPQVSRELKGPKANTGRMPVSEKKSSINMNNPPAKSKKLKSTVNFVGGVHAIYIILYQIIIDV